VLVDQDSAPMKGAKRIGDPHEEGPLLLVDQNLDDELRCLGCGGEISECQCLRAGEEE
jgi:hypothetical protein